MATSQLSRVVQQLRRATLHQDGAGLTDGQLLESFLSRRDEAAMEALVRRHGPMVWGVCRRLLNHHDAEDAFQATFLVLVRKAASVVPREMVANWLYGVARQTALKTRATTAKRRTRERQVMEMPEPAVTEPDLWHDPQPLLDEELSRLPAKYRVVIILCDLEGKTRKEAARQLKLPEGTVASRMATARTKLAKRLARHGLAVSGGALAAVLSQNAASACVPTSLVASTVNATSLLAAGEALTAEVVSAKVAALTEGVLKTMWLTQLKIALAVLLVVAGAGVGVGGLFHPTKATEPASLQTEGEKKATEKKAVDEKTVDQNVKGVQAAQADDEERIRREEERKRKEEERSKMEAAIKKLQELEAELRNLRQLFSDSDVDVFIDGDTQKPFIKGAKFHSVVEMSGRRFLQFARRAPDGKVERLLIDPARIAGLRISD